MSQFGEQMHSKSNRKASGNGKKLNKSRDKRRHEFGGHFAATRIAEEKVISKRLGRGRAEKTKLKHADFANVLTKTGYKKARIKAVIESRDNRNFARLGIITKGALIDTELGRAMVVNRPGREGAVNAVLVEGVKA